MTSALRDCSGYLLFKEYPETFMTTYSKHNHKLSTQENYRIAINKHFMPVFGERSLDDVKKKDIKAFIYALQGCGAFPAHDTDIR